MNMINIEESLDILLVVAANDILNDKIRKDVIERIKALFEKKANET